MRTALLYFIFILLLSTQLLAQTTDPQTKYIIGPTLTAPLGVVADNSGNIYVAMDDIVRVFDVEGNYINEISVPETPSRGRARAIAIDKEENLFIFDALDSYVYKVDREGKLLFKFITPRTSFAGYAVEGIAVAPDGSIYITDFLNNLIRKFNSDGKYLFEFKTIKAPVDVAIGPDGNVYIADPEDKSIVKYSDKGEFIVSYKTPGSGTQGFIRPTGVEVGSDGTLYVADAGTTTVYTFKETGEKGLTKKFDNIPFNLYMGVALDASGHVFLSFGHVYEYAKFDTWSSYGKVAKISSAGEVEKEWGKTENINRIRVSALEIDKKGHYIYVGDDISRKILKYNRQGIKVDEFGSNGSNSVFNSRVLDIATGLDDALYVYQLDNRTFKIRKYSSSGKYISTFEPFPEQQFSFYHSFRVKAGLDNYIYVLGDRKVMKYDTAGKFISLIELSTPNLTSVVIMSKDISVDKSGNIYILYYSPGSPSSRSLNNLFKYSNDGEVKLQYKAWQSIGFNYDAKRNISVDNNNNIYVAKEDGSFFSNTLRIFNDNGVLIKSLPNINDDVSVSLDGNTIVTLSSEREDQILIMNTSSSENKLSYITGYVYLDENNNNVKDAEETGLKDFLVRAEPGSIFGKTDNSGKYKIVVDTTGTYQLTQLLPQQRGQEIVQVTPEKDKPKVVSVSHLNSTLSENNFGNKVTLSPYLTTSVSSTRRRRCFESTTKVTYANSGFAAAEKAKVYLKLPKEIELLSADKPYTKQSNNMYVFDVGTVAPGETKTITIQDKVTCGDESVRGLTVCTKAWISTGKLPEKPIATVTGECDPATGRVRFVIRNTGPEDMETGKLFRIYRDGKLSTVEQYKLAAGDSLVLWIPAVGKTIRLEAEQPDGNGDNTLASATIEGCQAGGSNTPISTGFVNALPPDEEEAEVAEECLLITDSFDPNDKQVTPTGLTSENYTPTGVALTYKIRFQNTGTDVAYRVVVVDTLSQNLDISTLQMGSASHNYRFDVSGKGSPVLTWTFDNILLPDSNSNEPGSHGYIQFSIKPKADLPGKTLVENFADIFFDYNSPVRTNITANRIYDMPEVINEGDKLTADEIIATPGITGFNPESGKFGTEVIVSGKKFSLNPALNKVYFNGLPATIVSASETELKVIVPANATSGILRIQTNDGVAQSITGFEVYQPPVVNSFSPIEGITGTTVTLEGKHLTEAWLQTIKLGDQVCEIISREGNKVVVKVPEGAVTGKFEAFSKGGEVQTINTFVVWHQPTISNLSKLTDKAGATIEIRGSNFASAPERNKVMFGTVSARVLQATSATLKVQVPKGAENGPVTIETPGGIAESAVHFTFIPAPDVLSFTPAIGTVGTDVTLTGKNFLTLGEQDTITFNGQKAVVLEATPTLLKVRVPRWASSGKIKVAGIGGYAVTADDFRIEELSPEQAIEVYPNPTTGNFTIRFMHADFEVHQVQLFSALGQLVYSEKVTSPRPDKLEIKLATPKPGMYILHIKTERGLVIKKLNVL
ncbi:IPT/TIG domain-containing protein [Pontibacter sp. BT310]|uniref:IPT/TIG domain-containing protein n=1 Tax=Pontibacter populi TaxID=890055 RepID=A0ABS6XB29_9BACT|nr:MULTISPECIES: IPT/TIG domain-containing protein [Pontibacter]MBJ6118347.1 IPT/TIG domain-containing protein [Pontibacter sp. BT310]MBR0570774.1 IPT/TIG domain-containing protein [Microvirga sp. STS03]MBW3365200.1 IPT/TIG domain-containing protein [Pontibacter populi]